MQVLSEDCYLDRKNEIPAGKKPYFVLPVFNRYKVSLAACMLINQQLGKQTEASPWT